MKKVCVYAQLVGVALTGCAMASNECAQIAAEQRRMYTLASELASLGDTGAPEAEYARLREEFAALRKAATMKKCQGSTPARQQAASDASAAQGGTGPRIAPPETPLE